MMTGRRTEESSLELFLPFFFLFLPFFLFPLLFPPLTRLYPPQISVGRLDNRVFKIVVVHFGTTIPSRGNTPLPHCTTMFTKFPLCSSFDVSLSDERSDHVIIDLQRQPKAPQQHLLTILHPSSRRQCRPIVWRGQFPFAGCQQSR